jgi:hypothetical protein
LHSPLHALSNHPPLLLPLDVCEEIELQPAPLLRLVFAAGSSMPALRMCEEMEVRPVPPLRLVFAAGDGGGALGGPALMEGNVAGSATGGGNGERGGPTTGSAAGRRRRRGVRRLAPPVAGGEGAQSTGRRDKEEGH